MTSAAAALLAFIVGDLLAIRRAHVRSALARAGIPEPERVARRMYRSLGAGLLELIAMALMPWRALGRRVTLPTAALDPLRGRGFVAAVAHTGNWDLVACACAAEWPLLVVTKRFRVRWLDRLWQSVRTRRGVGLVTEGEVLERCLPALRQGRVVAMMVDQAPERARAVTRVAFLGQLAAVDLAPALLALRARVPLVAAFPVRRADGSHALEIATVLVPPARAARAWAVDAMRVITARLEEQVRRTPDQWLWMHRRWKKIEAGG